MESIKSHGYYVLPILHGDALIGRISMKMDRKQAILSAEAVYAEENAPDDGGTVTAVRQSVEQLAQFLDAKQIDWGTVPAQWQTLAT